MDLCVLDGSVGSDEVVFLEGGVLYKQKFVVREGVFPEGIRSFPFFHFQVSLFGIFSVCEVERIYHEVIYFVVFKTE